MNSNYQLTILYQLNEMIDTINQELKKCIHRNQYQVYESKIIKLYC